MNGDKRSDISGFHKLEPEERLRLVQHFAGLTKEEADIIRKGLPVEIADKMIENVIGCAQLPLGIATNFRVNGRDVLIPMAIEESSVVAAACHAAKMCRSSGGFSASADEPVMIGQVQLVDIPDAAKAVRAILSAKKDISELANARDSTLISLGGGCKDIEVRELSNGMLVVHLLVDVRDAMGANAVNTMVERVAPVLEKLSGGRSVLKIISNLAVHRLARAKAVWTVEEMEQSFGGKIDGKTAIDRFLEVYELARADIFREATHNKGIMNGIDSVMIATGNDWRAIEAGAHTFARVRGNPLTRYYKNERGDLVGEIELPLAAGIVGGATKINPLAKVCLKILGMQTAKELAEIAVCVGLANNFAALRAISTEGIQAGHMKLHAINLAVEAGAHGETADIVAKKMVGEGNISVARAKEILEGIGK